MRRQKFYEVLSKELWNIPNHPFFRDYLYQQQQDQNEKSYDPKRLFVEKDINYIEFPHDQRRQQEYQFNVYKKKKQIQKLGQAFEDQMEKVVHVLDPKKYRKYPFQFGLQRGLCTICPKPTCTRYKSTYSICQGNLFQCNSCHCPMNSHQILNPKGSFYPLIYDKMQDCQLSEQHLRSKFVVLALQVQDTMHYDKLHRLINQQGLSVLCQKQIDLQNLINKLCYKGLFSLNNLQTQKNSIDKWIVAFRTLERGKSQGKMQKQIEQLYFKVKRKIQKKFANASKRVCTLLLKWKQWKGIDLKNYKLLYASKGNYQKIIDSYLFFPEFYTISFYQFLLPQETTTKIHSLLDHLDFNHYFLMREDQNYNNVKNIFHPSIKVHSQKVAKLPGLQITGNSYFRVPYSPTLFFQRCMMILRPITIRSGIDQIFLNVLRANELVILNRKFVNLSQSQARYLCKMQNIEQSDEQNYIDMMKRGTVQLILFSGKGAILKGQIICNGNIKSPHQQQNYSKQQKSGYFNNLQAYFDFSIFTTYRQMLDLNKILVTNNMPPSLRQTLASQIPFQSFNYLTITTSTVTNCQQIASIFMPYFLQFNQVFAICRPESNSQQIRQYLALAGFKIVFYKRVLLSRPLAMALVMSLDLIKQQQMIYAQLAQQYSKQKIQVYCLTKPSAYQELTLTINDYDLRQKVNEQWSVQKMLIPARSNESIKIIMGILSPALQKLQRNILNRDHIPKNHKAQLYKYFINTILGADFISQNDNIIRTSIGPILISTNMEKTCKLVSFLFKQISNHNPHYVPLIFKYRTYENTTIELTSYPGGKWHQEIEKMRKKTKEKKNHSLILFLWAQKLLKMVDCINKVGKMNNLSGYNACQQHNNIFYGSIKQQNILHNQNNYYRKLLQQIQLNPIQKEELKEQLQQILNSKTFQFIRSKECRRMVPEIYDDTLRIVTQGTQIDQYSIYQQYKLLDFNYQLQGSDNKLPLCDFYLSSCPPLIASKYYVFSQLYFILQKKELLTYVLQQIKNQQILLKVNPIRAEIFLLGIEKLNYSYKSIKGYRGGNIQSKKLQFKQLLEFINSPIRIGKDQDLIYDKYKTIPHERYFQPTQLKKQSQLIPNKINLYQDVPPIEPSILYQPDDRLMRDWANQAHYVKMVQRQKVIQERTAINVQLSEKDIFMQKMMMKNIENQKKKLQGLKKVKQLGVKGNRMEEAVQKQVQKFLRQKK